MLADGPDTSDSPSEPTTPATPASPACDCCPDPRIAAHFDRVARERTEDGNVMPPMVAVSERLLAQLGDVTDARPTILELGCGSAALLVTLLTRGARGADGVDLSSESIAAAQRRAADAGVGERAHFEVADGAATTHAVHDWVVLDRSMCCYPDMPRLLGAALSANPSRVCFSVPTSRGVSGLINKIFWGFEAKLTRFNKGWCRGYVHSLDDIERRLSAAGFRLRSSDTTLLWYTAVWDRATAA
jgi:SAM-dependent methyltransferase